VIGLQAPGRDGLPPPPAPIKRVRLLMRIKVNETKGDSDVTATTLRKFMQIYWKIIVYPLCS
jgi:hypothetical protein